MLYKNDGKIYIKVSEKFIEVDVRKSKNGEYDVIAKDKSIEAYGNKNKFSEVTLEQAYEILNKNSKKLSLDDENLDK